MEDTLFSVKEKIIIVTGGLGQLGAQVCASAPYAGGQSGGLCPKY